MIPNQFILLLAIMILLTLVYNPISTLIDTILLDFEEQSGGKYNYGQMRLWSSIGWAVSSMITGHFINSPQLPYIFFIASGILAITWLIIKFIYKPLKVKRNLASLQFGIIRDLLKAQRGLRWFFLLIFGYSVAAAPVYLIINMYYYEIGATNSIIGIAFAVQAITELPFFFYGKKIVQRFGAKNVFLFTMIATGLRMVGYGFTNIPEIAIVIGMIHGISIGLFMVSMVEFVHNIVPSELRSTGQSLIYTFYAGGVCFGNFATGFMNNYISMQGVMIANGLAMFAMVIFVLLRKRILGQKTVI